jgi:hypothetical protein
MRCTLHWVECQGSKLILLLTVSFISFISGSWYGCVVLSRNIIWYASKIQKWGICQHAFYVVSAIDMARMLQWNISPTFKYILECAQYEKSGQTRPGADNILNRDWYCVYLINKLRNESLKLCDTHMLFKWNTYCHFLDLQFVKMKHFGWWLNSVIKYSK